MKNLFHIKLSYLTNKTCIEIALSSHFKALMAEATAICLAFVHTGGGASGSSGGLAVLQKLAFDPAAKSKYTPKETLQALDLVCRAALHYSNRGRPYDNLARVIVLLAQASPCRFPRMRLPERKNLPGRPHFSDMGTAAYELLRQSDGRPAPEVPIFVAYHLAHDLSQMKQPPEVIKQLLLNLHKEVQLFVVAMTCLAELSDAWENSKALDAAMRN